MGPTRLTLILLLALAAPASAQAPVPPSGLRTAVERDGRAELPAFGLVAERFDFMRGTRNVEALVVRPAGEGRRPGLLLIPGHSRTAWDMLPQAVRFARAGFAVVAVTQPGYGGSHGPADFAGPLTFDTLVAAAERFAASPFVDRGRMGVYGYSRGALAGAQLAARTDLFRASVLGGGIYDFRAAYDQIGALGIRANMLAEAGLGEDSVRARSPIRDLAGLDGPMLIVHGGEDENAPVAQARALAAALEAIGKDHELMIVPGRGHALGMDDIIVPAAAFFTRYLSPVAP